MESPLKKLKQTAQEEELKDLLQHKLPPDVAMLIIGFMDLFYWKIFHGNFLGELPPNLVVKDLYGYFRRDITRHRFLLAQNYYVNMYNLMTLDERHLVPIYPALTSITISMHRNYTTINTNKTTFSIGYLDRFLRSVNRMDQLHIHCAISRDVVESLTIIEDITYLFKLLRSRKIRNYFTLMWSFQNVSSWNRNCHVTYKGTLLPGTDTFSLEVIKIFFYRSTEMDYPTTKFPYLADGSNGIIKTRKIHNWSSYFKNRGAKVTRSD